ncbi:MAG: DUF58 domain-containing protein [Chitinophagaceae bacterium]|nr:DUF58 domain-containing protein [Chitinophagaceae bacterium]
MLQSFFLNKIAYYVAALAAVIFVISYFFPSFFEATVLILVMLAMAILVDTILLYTNKNGIRAERRLPDRFSIGDEGIVSIVLKNRYGFQVQIVVIDELPEQFQARNWKRNLLLLRHKTFTLTYAVQPMTRGEYVFYNTNILVQGPLQLVKRRFVFENKQVVKVYPSYLKMRRYRLLAISNRLQTAGIKKIRKLGHSMEFEQIKEYVRGDDYRTINWKATARKDALMVNNYTDEKSQQIYCLINKGRVMKMPFEGMSLLDYAINASLVLSNVALIRQDKAGIISFEKNLDTFLPADKKPVQMNLILESLYRQQTDFLEADFEKLFSVIRHKVTNRSLLVLFTNFESLESLNREMNTLKKMAKYHLLLVVFFENTELKALTDSSATSLEDIYIKTIAEKFSFEKRQMVKELHKNGIQSILTTPADLNVNTINKYLELKTRMSI